MASRWASFPERGANEQIAESWRGHGDAGPVCEVLTGTGFWSEKVKRRWQLIKSDDPRSWHEAAADLTRPWASHNPGANHNPG